MTATITHSRNQNPKPQTNWKMQKNHVADWINITNC